DTTDITATWFFDMPEPVTYVPTQVSPITCHLCADPTHGVIAAQLPTQGLGLLLRALPGSAATAASR
ncbi:hypothetical protein, partial [Propionibacterium freudenreichii]|uniref:hypothetical protein n=1 Tax=Propionibacterium freudenreichii TaxID=1744 RepID=UPI001C644850